MTVAPAELIPGVLLYLLASLPFWFAPALRTSGLYFSVRVTDEFRASEAGRRIGRAYRIRLALLTAATVAIAVATHTNAIMAGSLLVLFAGAIWFCVAARKELLPFAVNGPATRTASLAPADNRLPGGLPAATGPFVILAANALWLQLHWDQIPPRFPIHFNIAGKADRWAQTTWSGVYGQLIVGEVLLAAILLSAIIIVRTAPGGTEWSARFRKAATRVHIGGMWIVSILMAFVSLNHFYGSDTLPRVVLAVVLVAAGILSWPLFRMSMMPGSGTDRMPDNAWKLGIFYYNPDDPALMVRRRFTPGYTLNFGNRMSWAVVAGTLVLLVFVRTVIRSGGR